MINEVVKESLNLIVYKDQFKKQVLQEVYEGIASRMVAAVRTTKVLDYLEDTWCISRELAQELIDDVFESFKQDMIPEIRHAMPLAIQRRLDLYGRCLETGDLRTAAGILRDTGQLQNLYASTGTEQSQDTLKQLVTAMKSMTDAAVKLEANTVDALVFDNLEVICESEEEE